MAFRCDIAKEQDVHSAFEEMEKHLGPVNFLVNAAGINRLVKGWGEFLIPVLKQSFVNIVDGLVSFPLLLQNATTEGCI